MFDEISEYKVLAALVDYPELAHNLRENLFTEQRQALFTAFKRCIIKYGIVTTEGISLLSKLQIPGEVEAARGLHKNVLGSIIDRLANLALRRELVTVSNNALLAAAKSDLTMSDARDALILPPLFTAEDNSIIPGIEKFISILERKRDNSYEWVHTGMSFLDKMLGGEWGRGELIVLAGGAGSGKTAAVTQSTYEMGVMGLCTQIFSLEMSRDQLVNRYLSYSCSINSSSFREGKLTNQEVERMNEGLQRLQHLPILIEDRGETDIEEIIALIERGVVQHGVKAVFIDYLQIIKYARRSGNMTNDYGDIAKMLKACAKRKDIPIILLSQLSRGDAGILDRLRGSGEVGEVADTVIGLTSALGSVHDVIRAVTMDFVKNRNGQTGQTTLAFEGRYLKFLMPDEERPIVVE